MAAKDYLVQNEKIPTDNWLLEYIARRLQSPSYSVKLDNLDQDW